MKRRKPDAWMKLTSNQMTQLDAISPLCADRCQRTTRIEVQAKSVSASGTIRIQINVGSRCSQNEGYKRRTAKEYNAFDHHVQNAGKEEAFPRQPFRCKGRLPDTVVISCRNLGQQFDQKPVKRLKNISAWITLIRAKPLISLEGKGIAVFDRSNCKACWC